MGTSIVSTTEAQAWLLRNLAINVRTRGDSSRESIASEMIRTAKALIGLQKEIAELSMSVSTIYQIWSQKAIEGRLHNAPVSTPLLTLGRIDCGLAQMRILWSTLTQLASERRAQDEAEKVAKSTAARAFASQR